MQESIESADEWSPIALMQIAEKVDSKAHISRLFVNEFDVKH